MVLTMSKVILFQGDSITDCLRSREYDSHTGDGYPSMVIGAVGAAEPYQYTFYNRGISGNRVVDLYARIRKDMIILKPDYISILIGINDVWHEYEVQNGVDAEKFELVYNLMVEELKRELPGVKIMLLEPFVLPGSATENTPEHPDRWEYFRSETDLRRAAAKRVAEKQNVLFVPLQDIFDKANADAPFAGYWLKDGVHPSGAGHELIKREWLKAFEMMK